MYTTELSACFCIYFMLEQILHAVWSAVLCARYSIFVEKMNAYPEPSDAPLPSVPTSPEHRQRGALTTEAGTYGVFIAQESLYGRRVRGFGLSFHTNFSTFCC